MVTTEEMWAWRYKDNVRITNSEGGSYIGSVIEILEEEEVFGEDLLVLLLPITCNDFTPTSRHVTKLLKLMSLAFITQAEYHLYIILRQGILSMTDVINLWCTLYTQDKGMTYGLASYLPVW